MVFITSKMQKTLGSLFGSQLLYFESVRFNFVQPVFPLWYTNKNAPRKSAFCIEI